MLLLIMVCLLCIYDYFDGGQIIGKWAALGGGAGTALIISLLMVRIMLLDHNFPSIWWWCLVLPSRIVCYANVRTMPIRGTI